MLFLSWSLNHCSTNEWFDLCLSTGTSMTWPLCYMVTSVGKKLSWLIRHLSDGFYIFFTNLWNLPSDIWAQPSDMFDMSNVFCLHWWWHISRVSCKKGPTRHAYAWQIGPFWQDTLELYLLVFCQLQLATHSIGGIVYMPACESGAWISNYIPV